MDNTELENLYESMINEQSKTNTAGNIKAGQGFEGAEKAQGSSIKSPKPTDAEGVRQKTPNEGPSQGKDQGKPATLTKKVESTETSIEKLIPLTFDELYKKTLNEEEDSVVPASDIESSDFSEDTGDFAEGEDTDVDEEIDLSSELRLLADRLNEIADKLSVEDGSDLDSVADEIGAEGGAEVEGDMGGEGEEFIGRESVQHKRKSIKEAIKSEPTPKPLKKTTLGPKMSQNPKNKIGKSGAGKATTPAGKDRTGQLSVLAKTTFGPKMSQNPSGTGPAVKGANANLVS